MLELLQKFGGMFVSPASLILVAKATGLTRHKNRKKIGNFRGGSLERVG
jgi:hypothetical protein